MTFFLKRGARADDPGAAGRPAQASGGRETSASPESDRPFQLVKFLSWSFFVLILGFSLALSIFIANTARQTIIAKHQDFALLLAENLNHQIYRGFTLPTLVGFGRIQLSEKPQFDRLDQVVKATIHSFHVLEVRIYDFNKTVSYSTTADIVGRQGLAGASVDEALQQGKHNFEIVSKAQSWLAPPDLDMDPESVVLRTVYPLRAERALDVKGPSGPIMGALEIKQDITADYEALLSFQVLVVGASGASALAIFFILLLILRRADRVNLTRLEERGRLERELLQSEKLASMGRMVASIAHEIRNPLGIIRSSAELLLRKKKPADGAAPSPADARDQRILQAIFDESKRLSQTVSDFLDYARPKAPRREPLDLARTLDQVLAFLERECEEQGVAVTRDYAHGLTILGDKDLLYRAFYNIVANALQAMQAVPDETGGERQIVITAEPLPDAVRITFLDTGPGFDRAARDKLLDPFFTTKESGTGLGLAIVNSIILGHGARLELGDNQGGGARVDIVFPRAEQAASSEGEDRGLATAEQSDAKR